MINNIDDVESQRFASMNENCMNYYCEKLFLNETKLYSDRIDIYNIGINIIAHGEQIGLATH